MAILNLPGMSKAEVKKVDERVEYIVNKNLSKEQKDAGVVAKVQVRHPAVSFIATVWQKDGRKWVSEPAQEGKKQWFPLVALAKEVRDYILFLVDHSEEDNSAWYLDMVGEYTTKITAEATNPDLGIEAITVDGNLTYNQKAKGMVCKVNIVTSIGSFLGYTIWNSKFGESLYGTAPAEGARREDNDDNIRGNPGYRLSREATAQVLAYLHPMVDFSAKHEIPEGALPSATAKADEAKMKEEGFQPVGDAMFGADGK